MPDPAQRPVLGNYIPATVNALVPQGQVMFAFRALTELQKVLPDILTRARSKGQQVLLLRLLCLNESEYANRRRIAQLEIELRGLNAMLQNQQERISILVLPCASLDELFAFVTRHQAAQLILTDELMQSYA